MRTNSRFRWPLYTVSILAAAVVLIGVSPLINVVISRYSLDWVDMGNIGQSYGTVSTMLSGAALLGVVITLRTQVSQARVAAEHVVRSTHLELMREAWNDPSLLQALELVPEGQEESARSFVYVNLYFMYLRLGYLAKQISLSEIEDLAAHTFSTPAGRYYWSKMSDFQLKHLEPSYVEALTRGFQRATAQADGFFLEPDPESDGCEPVTPSSSPPSSSTDPAVIIGWG